MKFWDSSALVPLFVKDRHLPASMRILKKDDDLMVWWMSDVECASAISRWEREGHLSCEEASTSFDRLMQLREGWHEIEPIDTIRDTAKRLLRVHTLRAADALQLASAILASEHQPSTLDFVCFDQRLNEAAQREGFNVWGYHE